MRFWRFAFCFCDHFKQCSVFGDEAIMYEDIKVFPALNLLCSKCNYEIVERKTVEVERRSERKL